MKSMLEAGAGKRLLTVAGIAVLSSALAACTVPPVEPAPLETGDTAPTTPTKSTPTKSTTTGAPVDTTSAPTPVVDPAVQSSIDTTSTSAQPPAPKSTTWTGSLASTASVRFGGQGACDYDVSLTNVEVTLTLDAQNRAISSKVTALMNETTPQCDFAPLGTLPVEYDYAPTTPIDGLAISPLASPDNRPQGTLSFTGASTSASSIHATLVFHRTDASEAKLNWTVTAELDLTP